MKIEMYNGYFLLYQQEGEQWIDDDVIAYSLRLANLTGIAVRFHWGVYDNGKSCNVVKPRWFTFYRDETFEEVLALFRSGDARSPGGCGGPVDDPDLVPIGFLNPVSRKMLAEGKKVILSPTYDELNRFPVYDQYIPRRNFT